MVYKQAVFAQAFECMKKHFPFTISLTKEVAQHADERARQFGISRSAHLTRLIEEDYKAGKDVIMIVAEPSAKYQKFRESRPPDCP